MNNIHLSNIHNFTLQQVFDRVATHLLTQGEPAMQGRDCRYRGPAGTSCAVGCLLAEEEYDPKLEGVGINGERFNKWFTAVGDDEDVRPRPPSDEYDDHRTLLVKLQSAHDSAAFACKGLGKYTYGDFSRGTSPSFTSAVRTNLKRVAEDMGFDDSVLQV